MRRTIINLHLYLAAFFAPLLFIVVISGGGYLLDYKGEVVSTPVPVAADTSLDMRSETLEADVRELLEKLGENADFEYLRMGSTSFVTRPTSTTHYEFSSKAGVLNISRVEPDLQKRLVELHKGHGPMLFKDLQKLLALGLLFIVGSGLWLGLTSRALRLPTTIAAASGLSIVLLLVLI